jgi:hypothetical protein
MVWTTGIMHLDFAIGIQVVKEVLFALKQTIIPPMAALILIIFYMRG